jgi:hypothetical protein
MRNIPDKATPRYQVEIVLRICRRACPSQGPPPATRTFKETFTNSNTALLTPYNYQPISPAFTELSNRSYQRVNRSPTP